MGVAFKDIILPEEIDLNDLKNKVIILDAYNILYQFITTIRGVDGTPLKDANGNVTSHLVGLFSRTASLMQKGIRPVFVFDGKPPDLKKKIHEKRNSLKIEAEKKYLEAKEKGNEAEMKKYASRTSRLSKDMVDEAKKLISMLGLPVVQAPSEGEAQAAYMVKSGIGFAVGSQDLDSLVHGATKLVRNLSISGRRKKGRSAAYEIVNPEILDLFQILNNLGIDQNQLIALAMIIGTDYNPGGIKGIGPKNALKLVKHYKSDFESLFTETKWNCFFDYGWAEVYYLIKKIPVTDKYKLKWGEIDTENMQKMLVEDHNFSKQRVESTLEKLKKESMHKQQRSLGDY
jgi:flap endonuclease-1